MEAETPTGLGAFLCDAATGAIEALWRLWDFGTEQHLQNQTTGEVARVHCSHNFGAPASFEGGPFQLTTYSGRAVLAGPGDDMVRALHFGDRACPLQVIKKRRINYEQDQA